MPFLRSKKLPPYDKDGNTLFNRRNTSGVYLIYKKVTILGNSKYQLSYVGYSGTNLYKTLYRHFEDWSASAQTRTTYKNLKNIRVEVIYTNTAEQAFNLEKALIIKLKPKDNPNKYENYTKDLKKVKQAYDLYTGLPLKDLIYNKKQDNEEDPF